MRWDLRKRAKAFAPTEAALGMEFCTPLAMETWAPRRSFVVVLRGACMVGVEGLAVRRFLVTVVQVASVLVAVVVVVRDSGSAVGSVVIEIVALRFRVALLEEVSAGGEVSEGGAERGLLAREFSRDDTAARGIVWSWSRSWLCDGRW